MKIHQKGILTGKFRASGVAVKENNDPARVARMAERWANACNIWTGEPLTGGLLEAWQETEKGKPTGLECDW